MISAGLIAKYFPAEFVPHLRTTIMILSIAGIYLYAPADNPNRPITEEWEIKKFRIQSMIFTVVFSFFSMGVMFAGYVSYSLAIALGIGLEVFSITPIGFRFFDWIAGKGGRG